MVAVVWLEQDNTTQLCRVKAQGTTGCSPFKCDKYDVTCQCMLKNIALFHSYWCIMFFCFCSFPWYTNTPTHWNRHMHPKKKKEFTLSSSQKQTQKHKYTQTGKYSYSLLHEYTHARRYTHSTPPVAVIKSSHSALHCVKVTACFYFSLSTVFSFPDVHSSSPLRCLPVIPCHPTSPTPLLPADS